MFMSIIAFNCEYINLQKGNPWLFDEAEFFFTLYFFIHFFMWVPLCLSVLQACRSPQKPEECSRHPVTRAKSGCESPCVLVPMLNNIHDGTYQVTEAKGLHQVSSTVTFHLSSQKRFSLYIWRSLLPQG